MTAPTRRRLLGQAAGLAGAALAPAGWTAPSDRARLADSPFALGVASGEPAPDGMVLWTRLAPRPLEPDAGMPPAPVMVRWEVAEDPGLRRIVGSGEALATPERGHAVHAEPQGLRPGREYWYRFTAAGHASPVGRTLTAPARGADPGRLRLAYGSCQKWEAGYYAAQRALAADHPDLVLFLGDYIYERPTGREAVIRPHPPEAAQDLASYRRRYALYKSDPDLQAAHAAAPWMVIWDDHEVANDYGGDADRSDLDRAAFRRRKAAAYQAFFENMPLRRALRPTGARMPLHRALDWGRLAQFQFLDTRQHRDPRTCDALADEKRIPDCPERTDPRRSLLGMDQERWLHRTLRGSSARWNLLAQQYLMGELRLPEDRWSNDGWDGYAQTRRRVLETWRDGRVSNPVALGGDIHSFIAGDLALQPGGPPIASEFVGGSISSLGGGNARLAGHLARNPHLKFAEGERRGYARVELTPRDCTVTFRAVDNALVRESPVRDLARFVVQSGETGLRRA